MREEEFVLHDVSSQVQPTQKHSIILLLKSNSKINEDTKLKQNKFNPYNPKNKTTIVTQFRKSHTQFHNSYNELM